MSFITEREALRRIEYSEAPVSRWRDRKAGSRCTKTGWPGEAVHCTRPPRAGRRSGRVTLLLLAVPVAFFAAFLLIPLGLLLLVSVHRYDPRLIVGPAWTLENYLRFFGDPYYRNVLLYTLRIAGVTSGVSLVIAYPLAYFLARTTSRFRGWYVFLLLAPLMVGVIVRTYGWLVVLGREGTVNSLLLSLGMIRAPLRLLYTNGALSVETRRS